MDVIAKVQEVGKDKHPKGDTVNVQYGTAGFRTK